MTIKNSDLCRSAFLKFYILDIENGAHWFIREGYLKGVKVRNDAEEPYIVHEFEDDDGNTFYATRKCDIAIDEASALRECNRRNGVLVEMQECDFDGLTEPDDKFAFVSTLEMERDRLAYENDRLMRENGTLQRAKARKKAVIKELKARYNIPRSIIDEVENATFKGE